MRSGSKRERQGQSGGSVVLTLANKQVLVRGVSRRVRVDVDVIVVVCGGEGGESSRRGHIYR
jgi:hypothetical protein